MHLKRTSLASIAFLTACGRTPEPLRVRVEPAVMPANGVARAAIVCTPGPCLISVEEGRRSARLEEKTVLRAGLLPGRVVLAAEAPGHTRVLTEVRLTPVHSRSAFETLHLSGADASSFRRWFRFLAEAQYFRDPGQLPAEINDCAALLRYAYREALREHDGEWASSLRLPFIPSIPAIEKYTYPFTPLGSSLFQISDERFAEFADAKTLLRFNVRRVGDGIEAAQPGDLLFYRRLGIGEPFHSMIFLGSSQIENAAGPFVVYHTGDERNEIRRLRVDELPGAEWRPVAGNPRFLGVYRWNIL